jgi:hypothetical protein
MFKSIDFEMKFLNQFLKHFCSHPILLLIFARKPFSRPKPLHLFSSTWAGSRQPLWLSCSPRSPMARHEFPLFISKSVNLRNPPTLQPPSWAHLASVTHQSFWPAGPKCPTVLVIFLGLAPPPPLNPGCAT